MRSILSAVGSAFAFTAMGIAAFPANANPAQTAEATTETEPTHTILFASTDLGRSNFIGSGFERNFAAPAGARRFIIMATSGAGDDRQRGRPRMAAYQEATNQSAFLVGYRWPTASGSLALLAGAETDTRLRNTSRKMRTRGGGRIQIELWHHPDERSLVTASFVAGSSRPSAWSRVSLGRAIADRLYIGPEGTLHLEEGYLQWRVGAHLTGLRLWKLEGRISGGVRSDSDALTGAYWSFNVHLRL